MTGASLLVFCRCAGFMFRAPGFSHPSVPAGVRAGLALMTALTLAPGLHGEVSKDGGAFVIAAVLEFAIGSSIGMAASLLYDGAYAGGRVLDDYAGIRGSVPSAQYFAASAFGRVAALVFTCGLFLLGGYRVVIVALLQSFTSLPPGTIPGTRSLYAYAVALPVSIIQAALLVCAPAIAAIFITQLTLAGLTRVIPRFASFTLSFPLVFGVALISVVVALPVFLQSGGEPWLRFPVLNAR